MMSVTNGTSTTSSKVEWEGIERTAKTPCMHFAQTTLCCTGAEYSITGKRLVIVDREGCCCFESVQEDNTLRDNISDVDVSTQGAGWTVFCCGAAIDTVEVKTNAGSGKETKILHLNHGQGKVVKQILLRD